MSLDLLAQKSSRKESPDKIKSRNEEIDIDEDQENKTRSIGIGRETTSAKVIEQQSTRTSHIADECKYIGNTYDEKKHGEGTLSWPDGRIYKGAFYADQRHGFGTFRTSEISEFQGLYRQDERFGPGVLFYKSSQTADVGLWLSDDLIRLLYPHPNLHFDFEITDKKSPIESSLHIPSWYAPQELLSNIADFDWTRKKKLTPLFCKNIQDDETSLTRYLIDHHHGVQQAMSERRAQLDAYVTCFQCEEIVKEKLHEERSVDIVPPNETYEQLQLYNYTNKFWPLKKRATFPIEKIFSNRRADFPSQGPLESSSLTLFELAFRGDATAVRDLLMHRRAYVDVSDSDGFTALHFATYNVHINVVNILLDFGANINQFSDDGLTALTIAFLLYYGNDPLLTVNTALEHTDPVAIIPKATPVQEAVRSHSKDRSGPASRTANSSARNFRSRTAIIEEEKFASSIQQTRVNRWQKKLNYGYEMTDDFRDRIDDDSFRTSVYSLIKLLIRRGADPTISDWPIPILAFAVRAGDKEMVELLMKKKAQVNCRLSATRHVSLTPLHIACGCLVPGVIDIVRLLLENGAYVNAETTANGKEYLTLTDPSAPEIQKTYVSDQHGRTPLHIACTREVTPEITDLVRLLLEYGADPNAVCNGQTPLSLAIVMGNEALVNLLLDQEMTDPSTVLGFGNINALCMMLSIIYESRWPYAKRLQLIERLIAKNPQVLYPIRFGPKNSLGSCVDYAYYSFLSDTRISQTPYHALSTYERASYGERKELLSFIAKRFREEVSKLDQFLRLPTPQSELPSRAPSTGIGNTTRRTSRTRSVLTEKTPDYNLRATGEFHYCATCGRSIGVRLTLCKRCQKVCFCSKPCKVTGWNTFHKLECETPKPVTPSERPVTTSKTESTKNKLPSIRPTTKQTEMSRLQSVATTGTRLENFTTMEGALFKESVLEPKTPQNQTRNSRLPNMSVAKLIRQQRLKKFGQGEGNGQAPFPSSLERSQLSWNHVYNAPENYSFN